MLKEIKKQIALVMVANSIIIALAKKDWRVYLMYPYLIIVFYALGCEFLELGIIEYDPL